MPGRLYQAGRLEPLATIGDRVMLFDGSNAVTEQGTSTDFYECLYVEPIFGQGNKGTTLLWTQVGAAPAGYVLPTSGAASGSIAAGGQANSTPNVFNMGRRQLLQFRWLLRVIGTLPAGWVVDDLDVTTFLPPAIGRSQTLTFQSRYNARWQFQVAADSILGPASGANQTLPAVFPALSPFDWAHLTELYCYEQTYTPQFTLINNGSVAMNNAAMAVGIDIFGYRLDLQPIQTPDSDWTPRTLLGKVRTVPRDFIVVPMSSRAPSQQV